MFERIVRFALRNRGAVLFFTAGGVVAGVYAFRGLTIEAFPDPTDTQVNVITLFPGPADRGGRAADRPADRARPQRHAGADRACATCRCSACPTSR